MKSKYTEKQMEAFYKSNPKAIGNQGILDLLRGVVNPKYTVDYIQSRIADLENVSLMIAPGYFISAEKFTNRICGDYWIISKENLRCYLEVCERSENPNAKLYVQLAIIRLAIVVFRQFSNLVPSDNLADLKWRALFTEVSWWIYVLENLEDEYGEVYRNYDLYW